MSGERKSDLQQQVIAIEVPPELHALVHSGVGVTGVSWMREDGTFGIYPPLSERRRQIVNGVDPTKG